MSLVRGSCRRPWGIAARCAAPGRCRGHFPGPIGTPCCSSPAWPLCVPSNYLASVVSPRSQVAILVSWGSISLFLTAAMAKPASFFPGATAHFRGVRARPGFNVSRSVKRRREGKKRLGQAADWRPGGILALESWLHLRYPCIRYGYCTLPGSAKQSPARWNWRQQVGRWYLIRSSGKIQWDTTLLRTLPTSLPPRALNQVLHLKYLAR